MAVILLGRKEEVKMALFATNQRLSQNPFNGKRFKSIKTKQKNGSSFVKKKQ